MPYKVEFYLCQFCGKRFEHADKAIEHELKCKARPKPKKEDDEYHGYPIDNLDGTPFFSCWLSGD